MLGPDHVRIEVRVELAQPTGTRVQAILPLGGVSIIIELGAHEVSAPAERSQTDLDMTHAVLIDPATEQVI